MEKVIDLSGITGFDWDNANRTKNKSKHNVTTSECEEVFFNEPYFGYDANHSQTEDRYAAYGMTNAGRKLLIIFTSRGDKIRVISARNQDKKERIIYEKSKYDTTI